MAGDWIKLEAVTVNKPEVFAVAEHLACSHGDAFVACVKFWVWADQQSRNGHDLGVTKTTLDHVTGVTGFSDSLVKVGWLRERDGMLSIPNFDRHNGKTAKERALATKRKVTERSRSDRDKNATREEKRREEIKTTTLPPSGAFLRFWSSWPKSQRKHSQGKCWNVWQRADLDQQVSQVLAHVEALKGSEDWQKGYVPAPLVYLNQRRWEGAESQGNELRVAMP